LFVLAHKLQQFERDYPKGTIKISFQAEENSKDNTIFSFAQRDKTRKSVFLDDVSRSGKSENFIVFLGLTFGPVSTRDKIANIMKFLPFRRL